MFIGNGNISDLSLNLNLVSIFIWKAEKQKERHRQRFSICWVTPGKPTTAGVRSGWSHKPRTHPGLSCRQQGPRYLSHCPRPPMGCASRELNQKQRQRPNRSTLIRDVGFPTTTPSALPWFSFPYLIFSKKLLLLLSLLQLNKYMHKTIWEWKQH